MMPFAYGSSCYIFYIYTEPEQGCLAGLMVLDLEVGEENNGGVGGEEDEDVPGPVQVRQPNSRPEITEHSERKTPESGGHQIMDARAKSVFIGISMGDGWLLLSW
jgi:hypothetical protein